MTTTTGLIAALVSHVSTVGGRAAARRATRCWGAHHPALAGLDPASALAAAQGGSREEADGLVALLGGLAPSDEWAALTAVAVLARRLGAVVAGWRTRGTPPDDLADMEAELVARVWALLRSPAGPPTGPPYGWSAAGIVGQAWSATRTRRATELRRAARCVPLDPGIASSGRPVGPTAEETLTEAVLEAVAAGRVTRLAARSWWATRVAGHPTAAVAAVSGSRAGAVRVLRARTAAHLAGGGLGAA